MATLGVALHRMEGMNKRAAAATDSKVLPYLTKWRLLSCLRLWYHTRQHTCVGHV